MQKRSIQIMIGLILVASMCSPKEKLCAQVSYREIAHADSIINSSQALKLEVVKLKERVASLQKKVKKLEGNVTGLSSKVKELTLQNEKTDLAYLELEKYASQLLEANDTLARNNDELLMMNGSLKKSKESLEVAANAYRELFENEKKKLEDITTSFQKKYAKGCSGISHRTNRGVVELDEENKHKISWIDDMKLQVRACYAIPREKASNNVKVYFYLYRQDDTLRLHPLENSVPVVLTPNLELSDSVVIYYDGSCNIILQGNKKSLKTGFVYELEYEENVISNGKFKLD